MRTKRQKQDLPKKNLLFRRMTWATWLIVLRLSYLIIFFLKVNLLNSALYESCKLANSSPKMFLMKDIREVKSDLPIKSLLSTEWAKRTKLGNQTRFKIFKAVFILGSSYHRLLKRMIFRNIFLTPFLNCYFYDFFFFLYNITNFDFHGHLIK